MDIIDYTIMIKMCRGPIYVEDLDVLRTYFNSVSLVSDIPCQRMDLQIYTTTGFRLSVMSSPCQSWSTGPRVRSREMTEPT